MKIYFSKQVITGVRFVKKKGVIHLEIEQAVATEEGNDALYLFSKNLFKIQMNMSGFQVL